MNRDRIKELQGKVGFPSNSEIWKWWQTQNFQKEQGEQEYTMIYEIDLPKILKAFVERFPNECSEKVQQYKDLNAEMLGMLERASKLLKEIDDTLFHHNHDIVGWHLNGDVEPIMNFVATYDMEAIEEIEQLIAKAKK